MEAKHEFDFMQITENEFNLRMRQLNSKNVKPNAYKLLIITNLLLTISLIIAVTVLYLNEFAVIHNQTFFGLIFSKKETETIQSNKSYLQTNDTFTTQRSDTPAITTDHLLQFESNVSSLRRSLDESIANLTVHLNGKFDASNDDLINDLQNVELRLYAYENATDALKSQFESSMNAILSKQKQLETKHTQLVTMIAMLMNNSDENMRKIGEYVTDLNTKLTRLEYQVNEVKSAQFNGSSSPLRTQLVTDRSKLVNDSLQSLDTIIAAANHAEVRDYQEKMNDFLIGALFSRFTCKSEVLAGSTKVSVTIDYKSSSDCFYVVRSKEKRIQYWSDHVETEECCDYLRIIDGNDVLDIRGENKTLATRRISKSNYMYLYFHSDQSVEKSPFTIKFNEV